MDAYGDKVRLRAMGVADAEALWRWNRCSRTSFGSGQPRVVGGATVIS